MENTLNEAIMIAHDELLEDRETASAAARARLGRREIVQKTDAFLVHVCRHVSAMCDVILPAVRTQLPDGKERVHEYVQQCRRLERAASVTKRRLYGDSRTIALSWTEVWNDLSQEFDRLDAVDQRLIADLSGVLCDSSRLSLASRLDAAERSGPTRPHPNSAHTGRFAHRVLGMWARADRFWDATEGRIVSRRRPKVAAPARESEAG